MEKRIMSTKSVLLVFVLNVLIKISSALPDAGKYDFELNRERNRISLGKSLYKDSQIFIQITCESRNPKDPDPNITIIWNLSHSVCWDFEEKWKRGQEWLEEPMQSNVIINQNLSYVQSKTVAKCAGHITLDQIIPEHLKKTDSAVLESVKKPANHPRSGGVRPVWAVLHDGVYVLTLEVTSSSAVGAVVGAVSDGGDVNVSVHVELVGRYGYLSAADWPLLPFYGCMCVVYVALGVCWLLVSWLQWRDLLRVQFWIGAVILLGMLEKATFYAEYTSINSTGNTVPAAMLLAEWVSTAKRTLARMLVIIVSLGFGIVKPRLGPALHRVVALGILYLVLAGTESYLRVVHRAADHSRQLLIASIPLAALDSAICWWIFTSLVQTTRTLRLRRNATKLSLYKHFTNTLIFSVIASVIFMLYSIRAHKLPACLTDWKQLWLDEAYWHILFSLILLVIMILWRPTNNNQRYAFTPLLDNPDDDMDDAEEEHFVSDAYGVKVRFHNRTSSPRSTLNQSTTNPDDDIRWVEDNIPSNMGDTALPILDSDEEIMNTKFEVSKMQ